MPIYLEDFLRASGINQVFTNESIRFSSGYASRAVPAICYLNISCILQHSDSF